MITYHEHMIAPAAFTPDECDIIIEMGEMLDNREARVTTNSELDLASRKSTISFFNPENSKKHDLDFGWIYEKFFNVYTDAAEEAGWRDWNIVRAQPMQYTSYTNGGFYTWHPDAHRHPYSTGGTDEGMIRKVSATILLSDPDDYSGGNFWLETPRYAGPHESWQRMRCITADPEVRQRGTIIFFPSYLWHKVDKVKTGTRKSGVMWLIGPPWS